MGDISLQTLMSSNLLKPDFWWQYHYEPTFTCPFEERLGNRGDGGKWICDPYRLQEAALAGKGCLLYSIGSNGQFDFETAVHNDISELCEIHTVDLHDWKFYDKSQPPDFVQYHVHEVGPPPATTIPSLVDELGHNGRTIDIFKIDCEGCEWDTYQSWFDGNNVLIRQVLVELHGPFDTDFEKAHNFMKFMTDSGYVIFHKEPNTEGCGGNCLEFGFLKMSPEFFQETERF